MEIIGTVKNVQGSGTYENNYGTFFKFDYEIEHNGKVVELSANHKGQTPFPIGTEVAYEIKGTNDYGSYGKVSKPKGATAPAGGKKFEADPKKQVVIVAQSSMTKAIDILMSGAVSVEFEDMNDFVKKAEDLADLLMKKQFQLTQKHLITFKSI